VGLASVYSGYNGEAASAFEHRVDAAPSRKEASSVPVGGSIGIAFLDAIKRWLLGARRTDYGTLLTGAASRIASRLAAFEGEQEQQQPEEERS
jgi:hypothetical protein